MTTNLKPEPGGGMGWTFDLDGIAEMYASYEAIDLWPWLESVAPAAIRAARLAVRVARSTGVWIRRAGSGRSFWTSSLSVRSAPRLSGPRQVARSRPRAHAPALLTPVVRAARSSLQHHCRISPRTGPFESLPPRRRRPVQNGADWVARTLPARLIALGAYRQPRRLARDPRPLFPEARSLVAAPPWFSRVASRASRGGGGGACSRRLGGRARPGRGRRTPDGHRAREAFDLAHCVLAASSPHTRGTMGAHRPSREISL